MLFLWLLPAIFVVHDFEEILTMESWLGANRERLRRLAERFPLMRFSLGALDVTQKQFAAAVMVEFLIISGVTALCFLIPQSPEIMFVYICFNAALFIHVFIHAAQSLFLKSYTPGAVTAVVVLIPGCIIIFRYLLNTGSADMATLYMSAPLGAILILPMVFGSLYIGKKLFKKDQSYHGAIR
jgi:hypothetical protein